MQKKAKDRPDKFPDMVWGALWIAVVVVLAVSAATSPLSRASNSTASGKSVPIQCVGETFLLQAHAEFGGGDQGWLVCFDKDRKQGKLYDPPFVVPLERASAPENGVIAFQNKTSSPGPDRYFLMGEFGSAAIDGTLAKTNNETNHKSEFQIHGIPIDGPSNQLERAIWGRYSSRRYIEDAGDLIGVDFMFFRIKGSPAGMITFYGGQLAEANSLIYNIKTDQSNKITFGVNSFGESAVCSAEFTEGQVRLQFLHNGSPIPNTTEVMKRQPTFFPTD
jgi:hypothetical protein